MRTTKQLGGGASTSTCSEEWVERTRSRGLPANLDELAAVETTARGTASTLRTSAGELADRFAPRLGRLRAAATSDDGPAGLTELLGKAQAAAARATQTQSEMDARREKAGAAPGRTLEQHAEAEQKLAEVMEQLGPANAERESLDRDIVTSHGTAARRSGEGRGGIAARQPAATAPEPDARRPGSRRCGLRGRPAQR